jgi:uncharacterized protein with PIN domain
MIVDASALLAILFPEPEAERFVTAIIEADSPRMWRSTISRPPSALMARTAS